MGKLVPSTFTNVFLLNTSIAESTFLQWIVLFLFLLIIISPWKKYQLTYTLNFAPDTA